MRPRFVKRYLIYSLVTRNVVSVPLVRHSQAATECSALNALTGNRYRVGSVHYDQAGVPVGTKPIGLNQVPHKLSVNRKPEA